MRWVVLALVAGLAIQHLFEWLRSLRPDVRTQYADMKEDEERRSDGYELVMFIGLAAASVGVWLDIKGVSAGDPVGRYNSLTFALLFLVAVGGLVHGLRVRRRFLLTEMLPAIVALVGYLMM